MEPHLVVITGGSHGGPKGGIVDPVAVSTGVLSVVTLLAGPAVPVGAFPVDVVLMDAGHQRPAATVGGHIAEGLVDFSFFRSQVIQSICNQPDQQTGGSPISLGSVPRHPDCPQLLRLQPQVPDTDRQWSHPESHQRSKFSPACSTYPIYSNVTLPPFS